MANFWTTATGRDPKRKYRFLLTISSLPQGAEWFVKTADRPSLEVASTEHKFLNHTFYYPGSVTWSEVSVTLVDPVDPDMQYGLANIMKGSGYYIPHDGSMTTTIAKSKAVKALNNVTIAMIDSDGEDIEKWTLHGAWISGIENSNLEYGSDDLSETTVKFRYDWASLETEGVAGEEYDMQTGYIKPEQATNAAEVTTKNSTPVDNVGKGSTGGRKP